MRVDGPGAKPKCGYIAITFSKTATYGRLIEGLWGRHWGQAPALPVAIRTDP
jgi:hypothetical protein